MVVPNMVIKFNNFEIFYKMCYIFNLSSDLPAARTLLMVLSQEYIAIDKAEDLSIYNATRQINRADDLRNKLEK